MARALKGYIRSCTQAKIQAKLDLAVALTLASWPALTLAVQNSWGGPNSAEKRDWFAGAASELLDEARDADAQYLEEFLLQVMIDEFEVNVEDGSGEEIAEKILKLRTEINHGDFEAVDGMFVEWRRKQETADNKTRIFMEGKGSDQEEGSESDSTEADDEDADMEEAPPLVKAPAEKPPPEIDEEGFMKVVRKRNR